ncbi:MAG TPA: glycosyltransferase family 1 protein [Chloroflexota bacterium]|nr:glycosyltransferase family 1 protein [Chloroflexota bacterium]
MRIAVDATAAVRQYAGVGRFARGLLGGLARVDAHNDYLCFAVGAARIQLAPNGLPARSSWLRLPLSERTATLLWQRWRILPPPTLLTRRVSLFFTPDFALPPVGHIPAIVTVHDLSFMLHPECADARLRRYLTRVVPRSVAEAAAVIAVSHTTAAAVHDLLGVPRDRIHVVPNGVDTLFLARASSEVTPPEGSDKTPEAHLRARFGLEPGYLLALGTLEPRKNYIRLLQAFAGLRRRLSSAARPLPPAGAGPCRARKSPITLVIAGREGWLYEPIFHEVARLGLGGAVRFLTRVDDTDLHDLYRSAGAFIYPSIYEGFGIPPLEAMASGVPVAASTGGALPEVLGDAACYFDPLDVDAMAEAMKRILLDEALRAELVARGYRRAAHYTWDAAACAALKLFQRVGA